MSISVPLKKILQTVRTYFHNNDGWCNKRFITWGPQKIVVSHEAVVLITEIVDKLVEGLLPVQAVQLPPALRLWLVIATLL